jgi:hypothetical protein
VVAVEVWMEVDGVGDAEAEWKPDLAGVPVELEALPPDAPPVGCPVALDRVLCVFADADDGVVALGLVLRAAVLSGWHGSGALNAQADDRAHVRVMPRRASCPAASAMPLL